MVFAAWRLSRWEQDATPHVQGFDHLLCQLDCAIAQALHWFQRLGAEVTRALRHDDRMFFAGLMQEASDFLAPNHVKDMWRIIRRHLPKFRSRRIGQNPQKIELLKDQWVPYFQQLEVGATHDAAVIVETCHARQKNMPIVQYDFQIDDLPSLIEVEDDLPNGQYFQVKPLEVRGLARVETVQAQGPLLLADDHRAQEIQQLTQELETIQKELQVDMPEDAYQASLRLRQSLSKTTEEWFSDFQAAGFDESLAEDLPDRWILLLDDADGNFGPWFEAEFMRWGQDDLPDVIAEFLDGRAEILVDEAFCELTSVFPRFELLQKRTSLQARLRRLTVEMQTRFPHRDVRKGSANVQERAATAAHVPAQFDEQTALFQQVRATRWLDLPHEKKDDLVQWVIEAEKLCGQIRADATWLPDYQGR
ncbi:unnamed protein product [Cladocopium goreaui]|uniref:Uncharacterized protein n=1 Tax=Cladocopium goreaui TaxID=2562237 RepID=A0A9P1CXG7_9DINO|nr:unnamed protein product [Cladocopium goreaui]